jgi:hypothetical protein
VFAGENDSITITPLEKLQQAEITLAIDHFGRFLAARAIITELLLLAFFARKMR